MSRNKITTMHFILMFKVKNAVIELGLLTVIVPIFTKGMPFKGFLFIDHYLSRTDYFT